GVLQSVRLSSALALVGGVEGERDEAAVGQALRVEAGGLFLDAATGVPDDNRRPRCPRVVVRRVQVGGDPQALTVERDIGAQGCSFQVVRATAARQPVRRDSLPPKGLPAATRRG